MFLIIEQTKCFHNFASQFLFNFSYFCAAIKFGISNSQKFSSLWLKANEIYFSQYFTQMIPAEITPEMMYNIVDAKLRRRPSILFKNVVGYHDAGGPVADVSIYVGAFIGSSISTIRHTTELHFYYDEFFHGRENFRIFFLVSTKYNLNSKQC